VCGGERRLYVLPIFFLGGGTGNRKTSSRAGSTSLAWATGSRSRISTHQGGAYPLDGRSVVQCTCMAQPKKDPIKNSYRTTHTRGRKRRYVGKERPVRLYEALSTPNLSASSWGNHVIKLRASPAKATMELPFAQNYPATTSELLLSPHRLAAVYYSCPTCTTSFRSQVTRLFLSRMFLRWVLLRLYLQALPSVSHVRRCPGVSHPRGPYAYLW
jgi:hypothetical protein